MTSKSVYLAGGFKSGWQDVVIAEFPDVTFFDPRSHGLTSEVAYTLWDTQKIRDADIIFGYAEASNPNPFGLMFEFGYAYARTTLITGGVKTLIYVEDQNHPNLRGFGMVRAVCDVHAFSLEIGILELRAELLKKDE